VKTRYGYVLPYHSHIPTDPLQRVALEIRRRARSITHQVHGFHTTSHSIRTGYLEYRTLPRGNVLFV
jgi:hypothetical protein